MDRARRAGITALIVVVMVAAAGSMAGPTAQAASVTWPPSTLVVSEVQTGGTSASDEFVEVANQGGEPVDLAGLEIVYATSTGSTVTRKATWPASTILEPGKRFLIANTAGIYGAVADATYSGGFAATGGAIGLRVVGGSTVDAVGWGDATSSFVEGNAVSAPPAGSSIERAPGGLAGNGMDTNDNLVDWFVQGAPSPQGRAAPAVPEPGALPTPTISIPPSPVPTSTPTGTPTATATPTASPTVGPTATPTATPTPGLTPAPTPVPTPTPTATATPTATPTPTPTPSATPTARPIEEARGLVDGTVVTIEGVLTTPLGAIESGHGGFVQDPTGGIALYLDAVAVGWWPAGTTITVEGTVSSRFSQRTLRIIESSLVSAGPGSLPEAVELETGAADESAEGVRVRVTGTITGAPDQLTDGLGVTVDDGSGAVRAVIGAASLDGRTLSSGMVATISGPLGQRDSSGTGVAGYRIHATIAGELEVAPAPTPSPTATPTPAVTPTPTATPAPSPTATATVLPSPTATPTSSATSQPTPTPAPSTTPTPVPTPTPATMTLESVRVLPVGSTAHTTGIVIAEEGRLGTPSLLAIGDSAAGLVVHLPSGVGSYPRGTRLDVTGKLAAPYGQLEIRPSKTDIHTIGTGPLPAPMALASTGLAEPVEGRLVTATGRLSAKPKKSTTGDLSFVLERDGAVAIKVMADTSSGIAIGSLTVGASYRVTGVVGQRATHSGALDGYRIWLRDRADLVATAGPSPSPRSSDNPSATTPPGTIATLTIARALKVTDHAIAIDATVTTPATLLDASGRRIVAQDATGAVELLLPTESSAPPIGARVHAEGRIGIAYGAPRLRVDRISVSGTGAPPPPLVLHGMPGVAHEWRLVSVAGRVVSIHKLGDRWRAEVAVGKDRVVIMGQAGAGIRSSTMVEGTTATVTGIARRPAPTASDPRYAVTPRFPADVRVSGQPSGGGIGGTSTTVAPPGRGSAAGDPAAAGTSGDEAPAVIDADLDALAAVVGRQVRVGGLVVELRADGFTLDDGTSTGRIALRGAALELLPMIEPDDALNAVGVVEAAADGFTVVVEDPGGIILAGDPNAEVAAGASGRPAVGPAASGAAVVTSDAVHTNRLATFGVAPWPVDAGAAGVGSLLAVSVVSVAVTVIRRSRSRRRLATRIAGRLASFAAPSETLRDPNVAEREPSTNHAA